MGKVPVDRERLTMVVIIGRIVAETSFRRKVTLFIRRDTQDLTISSIDARGNDDNTFGVRGDWNEVAWVKGQMKV